ncbi:hypothetical protein N2M06_09100 [Oceanimonas sp. AH20CE76]|uniref:hypothetical protein n=1 Tax=Oceanimonas sp. AH20CE76 TaxID=2977120 RepID=UPI0031FF3A09
MNHRKINNVGYKKIYPMSLHEDTTFCHYCGRKASVVLQLEWDHVPALNVKIPIEYDEVKKTLVRCCSECNSLASDIPHLDYLERHFWLKAAYLRRYKKLIVNDGNLAKKSEENNDYLNAVIENEKIKYESILSAIGFGIKSIDQIKSPILDVRTRSGRKVENILIEYLSGIPIEDEDDYSINIEKTSPSATENLDRKPYKLEEFIDFLAGEAESGNLLTDNISYQQWYKNHPNRVYALELPQAPHKHIGVSWERFNGLVKKRLSDELKDNSLEDPSNIIDDIKNNNEKIGLIENDQLAEYLEFHDLCNYKNFIYHLHKNIPNEANLSEEGYSAWYIENPYLRTKQKLPRYPTKVYNCTWENITHNVTKIRKELKLTSNETQHHREKEVCHSGKVNLKFKNNKKNDNFLKKDLSYIRFIERNTTSK